MVRPGAGLTSLTGMSRANSEIELRALRKQVSDLKDAAAVRRRLESALRDAEQLARATLEDCPIPLWRLDETGKLLMANEALARLLGYSSRHELLELVPVLGLFANGDQLRCIDESTAGQQGLEIIVALRRKSGEVYHGLTRVTRAEAPLSYTFVVWEPSR
jgi:PAS domain S-box-containing protein